MASGSADKEPHAEGKDDPTKRRQLLFADMYASDHKDQEKVSNELESNPAEGLYTDVKKDPKEGMPVNEPVSQVVEGLYMTVMKKPKETAACKQ